MEFYLLTGVDHLKSSLLHKTSKNKDVGFTDGDSNGVDLVNNYSNMNGFYFQNSNISWGLENAEDIESVCGSMVYKFSNNFVLEIAISKTE